MYNLYAGDCSFNKDYTRTRMLVTTQNFYTLLLYQFKTEQRQVKLNNSKFGRRPPCKYRTKSKKLLQNKN